MPYIPVANTVLAELRFTLQGEKVENTLYFHRSDPWLSVDLPDLGSNLYDWWVANMAPSLSDQLTLDSIHLTDLTTDTSAVADFVPSVAESGVVGGACLPNNVALCISFRTAARGRSGRGRNYICGIPDTHVTANTVDSADGIAFVSAYNLLSTVASTVAATWVVVSRFVAGAPRAVGITRSITSVLLVDLTVDSQRRRLPGRGS